MAQDFKGSIQLEPTIYATADKPFYIDRWWRQQVGEIEIGEIDHCSLFLHAQTTEVSVEVPQLNSRLYSYLYALLLQGVGYSTAGILLGGTNSSTASRVASIGWLSKYYSPAKVVYSDLEPQHLIQAVKLARGIDAIFEQPSGGRYLRLRKGFNAFLSGIRYEQIDAHNRLHQFVRSIDAVIKADQGKATKQFKERCQFFVGSNQNDVKLLSELYELRSAAEHLNPLDSKLGQYQQHERDNIKALRAYQAELLASFVYRKILSTPNLLSNFIDDAAIDSMWLQPPSQLKQLWGPTIDLRTAPNGLFFDYL